MENTNQEKLRKKLTERNINVQHEQKQLQIEACLEEYKDLELEVCLSPLDQREIIKEIRANEIEHKYQKIPAKSPKDWQEFLAYARNWIANTQSLSILFSSEILDSQHLFCIEKQGLVNKIEHLFEVFSLEDELLFDPQTNHVLAFVDMEDHIRAFRMFWDEEKAKLKFL